MDVYWNVVMVSLLYEVVYEVLSTSKTYLLTNGKGGCSSFYLNVLRLLFGKATKKRSIRACRNPKERNSYL